MEPRQVPSKSCAEESPMNTATAPLPSWRQSNWLVVVEFAIVAALFVADIYHHIFFSKTPYLFLLGWFSLRLRGLRWKDVGFSRPRNWRNAFLVGLAIGIAMELFELFVSQPLLTRWLGKAPDLSDFNDMVG